MEETNDNPPVYDETVLPQIPHTQVEQPGMGQDKVPTPVRFNVI